MLRLNCPTRPGQARLLCAAILGATLVIAGCGGVAEIPRHPVAGTVTFEGAAVEEGSITFEDPSTGFVGSADLGLGGTYSVELPEGNYVVGIEPPMVAIDAGPDTEPDEDYKEVDNIPEKYWYGTESGLTATVSASETTHDFDMSSETADPAL